MKPAVLLFCLVPFTCLFLTGCSKNETASPVAADSSPTAPTDEQATKTHYDLGKKVSFGQSGDSERFRGSGWSQSEPEITWTDGNSAVLSFSGLPSKTSLRLTMSLSGLTNPPSLPFQPVEVYANGTKIADWQVGNKADYTALISPATVSNGGLLKIELKLPKAISPKELGQSSDARRLGVSCFDLLIDKAG